MRNTFVVIFLAVALLLHAGYVSAGEAAGNKKELQRIKREMREKKKKITRANKKARSILAELDSIDRDIQAANAALALQQKELREAESALREIEQSNARISGELVAPYPPGIPVLAPGERVTAEALAALGHARRTGVRIAYAADPSLATLRVTAG